MSTSYNRLHRTVKQLALVSLLSFSLQGVSKTDGNWIKVDDFEAPAPMDNWAIANPQNETSPKLENPQITQVRAEGETNNHYLLKKPAADGVIGNRKAISFTKLPQAINIGETATFYLRINVESFPNNHVFGLSNMEPNDIIQHAYSSLEPSLRITDRYDKNVDTQNDGTLLVKKDKWYDKIYNGLAKRPAKPLETNTWYEVWKVVNNNKQSEGGQTYDIYIRGGQEFPTQQKVYTKADFRMKRELPIIYFFATSNTGSLKNPYGNGGLRYDDMYMVKGLVLSSPKSDKH